MANTAFRCLIVLQVAPNSCETDRVVWEVRRISIGFGSPINCNRIMVAMRTGRPVAELAVTEKERTVLERWSHRWGSAPALAQRSKIVLACAAGASNTVVATKMGFTKQTVGKWR